jgi:hypothetical protein
MLIELVPQANRHASRTLCLDFSVKIEYVTATQATL